ncbi:hypothetical protein ACFP3Q_14185 [Nocardioides sp. GCM10027113]|uniref:hypothetical protein n=1 Tax=unclassified Nocardioides TaxID=2615069 RepID=UPI003607251E
MSSDLGPMPEPEIEPGEPNPGGVDAIEEKDIPPAVPDLQANPAIGGEPEELAQPEETDDGPTSDGASNPTEETPA